MIGRFTVDASVFANAYNSREEGHAATRCSLRGSDAVYAAVALRFGSVLVSRDRQQHARLGGLVPTHTPEQAIEEVNRE